MKHYDIDDLVRSLLGADLEQILRALMSASQAHENWLRMSRKRRDGVTGTALYAQFAKGALFHLTHGMGAVPSNPDRIEFHRIRPLLRDMVSRGIAPAASEAWLRGEPGSKREAE